MTVSTELTECGPALVQEEREMFISPVTILKEIDSCWPVAYLKIASLTQRGLACCSPWDHKESNRTEQSN